MKASRIRDMERYITLKGTASMTELQEHFGISINTVRRDTAELIRRGTAEKVYGGVRARLKGQALTPYDKRRLTGEETKRSIGRAAAALVNDGDVIFVDSGTTTLQMIDFLSGKKDITLITHSLGAIERAVPNEDIRVIVLPGTLRRETYSVTGSDVVRVIRKYNIRTAFIAATGVSAHGATNSSAQEFDIKQAAVEDSEQVCLMADHTKFGVTGMMTFAPLESFDIIVTDRKPDKEYAELFRSRNIRVIVTEDDK